LLAEEIMSNVWHTSDIHGWHKFVSLLRGFGPMELREEPNDSPAVVKAMDAHMDALATNWSAHVRKDDIVWVQGDIALSRWRETLDWFDKLPGRKRLIWGNHDVGHPGINRDAHKHQADYQFAFETTDSFARVRYDGQVVLLSHFPYEQDRGFETRYPQWRLPNEGEWLLHGHTHSIEKIGSDREIHIGLDAWRLRPVNVDEIIAIMSVVA
jgi:calcineurin-like phosphoesterase family protein